MIIREFKQINGFSNYFINKDGILLSRNVGTILREIRPQNTNSGYKSVKIENDNGELKHMAIHRLVALTFLPNPNNLTDVNHIDGNKTNNCVENLEWCTRSYNCKVAYESKPKNQKTKCELFVNGESYGMFDSINKASIYVNDNFEPINIRAMSNQCRNGVRPYKGKYSIKLL